MMPLHARPSEPAAAVLEPTTPVLDLSHLTTMGPLLDRLAHRRVVFVGEVHDRYEDHLAQLAIMHGLRARGIDLVIGVEWFRQSDQPVLEDYVAWRIDERTLLRRTGYFRRWGYDVRLYRPILHYARQFGVPLIGLNLDRALIDKASRGDADALTPAERARLPQQIGPADAAYRARLRAAFERHPHGLLDDFERFVQVQLLWDEGMAERAARALDGFPDQTLVVFAGNGHLEYGQGIPQRLLRRAPVRSAIVLNGRNRALEPDAADYYIYPQPVALSPAGRLGVLLAAPTAEDRACAGVIVNAFSPDSAAEAAGIMPGDCIVSIDAQPVTGRDGIALALLDRAPGEVIDLVVQRLVSGATRRVALSVPLGS